MKLLLSVWLLLPLIHSSLSHEENVNDRRPCLDFEIAVQVQSANPTFDIPRIDNNIDAVEAILDIVTWSSRSLPERITGTRFINQTFGISARLCVPDGPKASILQIASHGIGFDKRYWDPTQRAATNSYVDAAWKAGYSILIYDRLGVGQSDKPDAYTVTQGPLEVEVLRQLTLLARAGRLVPSTAAGKKLRVPKFEKIALVGHSFGSFVTVGFLTKYGGTVDAAILTGFAYNSKLSGTDWRAFGFEYPPENDVRRFGKFGSGTLVQGTVSSVQQIFFKKGEFEPDMLAYAESIKQPVTIAELQTIGLLLGQPAPAFTGPVLFTTGENDFGICSGDCNGVLSPASVYKQLYPNASDITLNLQPRTGHGLTLHKNATGHYQTILAYLDKHGL